MMAESAYTELEKRVRTVVEELNGQRHVSLFQVEHATRNSEVLHAVRNEAGAATLRLDQFAGDMAAVKAALAMHGRALDVLMQDVRLLRSGQDEIKTRLDRLEADTAARFDQMRAEFDRMESRFDRMETEAAARRGAGRHPGAGRRRGAAILNSPISRIQCTKNAPAGSAGASSSERATSRNSPAPSAPTLAPAGASLARGAPRSLSSAATRCATGRSD
jgi:hypothetical protein